MDKENKKSKKAYLRDFKPDVNGKYTYQGSYFIFKSGAKSMNLTLLKRNLLLFTSILVISTISGGLLEGAGITNSFYVILPYIIEVGGTGTYLWAFIQFYKQGERIREYIYKASFEKMPIRVMVGFVGGTMGLVGNLIYVILNGFEGKILATVIYLVLKVLVMAVAFNIKNLVGNTTYEKNGSLESDN